MDDKKDNKVPVVPVPHFLAWLMFNQGEDQEVIAKHFKVTDRTVRNWLKNVEQMISVSAEWAKAAMIAKGFMSRSISIVDKYLDGKGEKVGGDLEAVWKLWAVFGILKPASVLGAGNQTNIADKQIVTALNCDIVINPGKDEEFASGAGEQLMRIVRAIEQSASGQVDAGSAEPEDTNH